MQTFQIEKHMNKSHAVSNLFVPVLSMLLTVCSFICLLSIYDLPCSNALVIALSVVIPAVIYYLLSTKTGKFVNIALPFILAAYFAAEYKAVWKGFLFIANSIITKINRYNSYGILTYDTGSAGNVSLYITMALVPLILILSYLAVISVKHRLFAPVILLTLPFVLSAIYFHVYAVLPAVALIILLWAVLFSNSLSQKLISLKTTALVLSVTFLLAGFMYFVIPYNKYSPSQKINSVRQDIDNGIESMRYDYGIKKVQIDTLPDGDLKNAKTLAYTDEVVMKVKMQKPSAVYLKGYVGGVYSNSRWNSLPATAYSGKFTGLFEWLSKNNFYPQSQISSLCGTDSQLSGSDISVDNIALESKYIYTPYEAASVNNLSPKEVNYNKDTGINSAGLVGTRSYSFSMYSPISADYGMCDFTKWMKDNINDNAEYTQYKKDEMAYRAFVYDNYLGVPDKTEKTLDGFFTKATIDSLKNKDYRSVIDFLRRYYLQKLSYSTEIKKLPADSDFIANFLKTRSGYDVHFATLSVMLLRSAGIPARYVEGYYLPHDYVDIYSKTENPTLDVKDSFAHAWAEIYVDGIGWIPAELTPGYYNADKDSSKSTGKDESVSNKNKNFYNDQENALTNDSANKQHQAKKNMNLNLLWLEIAAALLIVVAIIILIVFMLKAKRKKNFAGSAGTKAALKMYVYATKLIRFGGMKIDRHGIYEFPDEISKIYDKSAGMSFSQFMTLVYKARFGSSAPDAEELASMQNYVKSLAKQIYVEQSFGRKLILKISGMI